MPDTINGTGEGQPADDSIRGALAAALADREEPAEKPTPKADTAKPEPEGDAGEAPAAEGDADAKSSEKPEADATAEPVKAKDTKKTAEGDDKPEPAAADKSETDKKTAVAALTGKWSAKDKETFGKLPADAQELILRRHKEMEGAFTKKTQEIAAFRKEFEPVQQLLAPYNEQMKQHGWTPSTLISAWANVEKRLMEGDGVNVVAGIMKGYKLNLAEVAKALGFRPPAQGNGAADPARANGEAPPAVDVNGQALPPELQSHLNTLLSQALKPINDRLASEDQRRADEARIAANAAVEKVTSEIEQFKTAQDDKGNLMHPHFEEVEEMMTALAQAANAARKPVPPLAQLYETAVAANPDLREQVIAARVQAQRDKEAQAARAKAEKAKRASASVTGAPGSGQAPAGKRMADLPLREQLETAYAESTEG